MSIQYFLILAAFSGSVSSTNDCHACLEGVCYSKTPILDDYRFSGQLAVDRSENIVYFHYEDSQLNDYTAAFDLDDIRFKIIPNIEFSFARAVDQSTRDVYIGGTRGVYKYNPYSNNTVQYGLLDKTIQHMQFTNKIYYTALQSKGLYTFENKKSSSISSLSNYTIDDFVIDKRLDIYFLSQSNVYRLKKGANSATVIANDVYSLSVDKYGTAHFVHSSRRGLYTYDSKTLELIEVGAFGDGLPLKFVYDNNNNIIYHENNSRKLYYLMPNYGRCMVSWKSYGKQEKLLKTLPAQDINEMKPVLVIHRIT